MGLWKWLTGGDAPPRCQHKWKVINANVSRNGFGWCVASVTLECEHCQRREFHQKGREYNDNSFSTIAAGQVWIDSLLPSDHPKLSWTEPKKET